MNWHGNGFIHVEIVALSLFSGFCLANYLRNYL